MRPYHAELKEINPDEEVKAKTSRAFWSGLFWGILIGWIATGIGMGYVFYILLS